MKLLVTGGAGFVGSNLVRHVLDHEPEVEILNLDLLTYAGNLDNLEGCDAHPRHSFVHGDICDSELVGDLAGEVDAIVHLAAESHVDRSIRSAAPFVRTNVVGTQTLLTAALAAGTSRFVQVSTDEVYGELPWRDPARPQAEEVLTFTEDTPLAPRSPYSASKAAADLLVLSHYTTYGMDVVVTRSSNNYGPRQFPEKLVALAITTALQGGDVPVYGDGLHVRDWLHVEDHCRGIVAALRRGRAGRVYNFGGEAERTNLQVVRGILERMDLPSDRLRFVADRSGHDRRYAIDISRVRGELGWAPRMDFEEGLEDTVRWYLDHRDWWRRIQTGEYRGPRPTDSNPLAPGRPEG